MKADDREDFMTVMEKEIKYLTTEDVWEIITKSSLTTSAHIIRLLWSFKRKRNPFVELIKHKAHIFLHSGMIDFHSTFAHVVNWSTVRLIIIMAEISGWESRQIDYVLAFSQAPIYSDVYINLPENWFDILKTGVENKDLVFTPDGSNGIKCYSDAYFSGAWCREDADKVGSVLSRTGHIIKFTNFPIIWVSKIQTEIALSETEAEYISLIQSMRFLIPLRHNMLEVSSVFGIKCDLCNSYTTKFEENKVNINVLG